MRKKVGGARTVRNQDGPSAVISLLEMLSNELLLNIS